MMDFMQFIDSTLFQIYAFEHFFNPFWIISTYIKRLTLDIIDMYIEHSSYYIRCIPIEQRRG